MTRRATELLFACGLALAAGACASAATTSLRMSGNTPDAMVTVDDQLLGPLAHVKKRGVALPPGPHRVTVEKSGYFPFDKLIEAPSGGSSTPIELDVQLEKIPD